MLGHADTAVDTQRLTNIALGLLARREYSRGELFERLAKRTHDTGSIDKVLDRLCEQGIQSDERFVESFVRYRITQGKGPIKIRQDLRQRYIEEHHIDEYVNQSDDAWFERAQDVYIQKFKNLPVGDRKDFAKRLRFMASRGFSPQSVYSLLQQTYEH